MSSPFDFSKKIFYHPEKIVNYKNGRRPFPTTMEIDLTDDCNHACEWCYDLAKHKKQASPFLETNLLKTRLKEAYELGTRGINLSGGGEPMLHKDFLEIVEFAHGIGLDVGLITNGSAFHWSRNLLLCDWLNWTRISMASGDKESYHKIQGVDQFGLVVRNICMLCADKMLIKSKIVVGVRTVMLEKNIHTLVGFAKILKDTGIDYFQLAPNQFTTDGGVFWNSSQSKDVQEEVAEILKTGGVRLEKAGFSVSNSQEDLDYPSTCYAHFFQGAISAKGELLFCKNARGSAKYVVGNINDQTFAEIWNGEKVKEIESWVKPNNCGLFCKNMSLNKTMEEILHPPKEIAPNFVN